MGEDDQQGLVSDRYSDGEPSRGVPGPGQPPSARPGPAHQQRGRLDRRWSLPGRRRARLPAPEPGRRAAGAASPRRHPGVGGADQPRSGGLPGCRRRGQLHGHAPGRLRARQPGRLRQAGPARRDRRGGVGQRPQGRGVLLLPRRPRHRRLRPRRRGARPANREHPADPPAGPWSTSSVPAAAPRSW